MEYRRITIALLLSALVVAAACDDDKDTTRPQQQYANVRVVNASSLPGNASVNLVSNGTALTTSTVGFGTASASCVKVPVGNTPLAFRTSGGTTDIASVTTPTGGFQANQNYTVVLFGNAQGAAPSAVVVSDPALTASSGNNQLRFINATNSAGNVYVTTPNAIITSTTPAGVSNLAAGTASTGGTGGFITFPTANTQVRLFNTNATTFTSPRVNITLGSGNLALGTNGTGTVILSEATTGTGTSATNASFVVQPCS